MINKENKNIDQLFKDRLQGMETSPPPVVWENIQEALGHKKRERRVVPLWWKLGGVAAALVLLLTVANMFMSDSPDNFNDKNQLVIDEETKSSNKVEQADGLEKQKLDNGLQDRIHNKQEQEDTRVASENIEESVEYAIENKVSTFIKSSVYTNHTENTSVAATENITADVVNQVNNITGQTPNKQVANNTVVATNTATDKKLIAEKNLQEPALIKEGAINTNEILKGTLEESVANELIKETQDAIDKETIVKGNDKSIFDAIEEQKEAVANTTDALPADRWAISPNVAPVYYSSLGQGSSIDPSFADNTQNGEVNVSYGINVSYALSPRLTVRSGVSNVNLSYATGGLELATGDASAALQSVRYNSSGTVVTAVDQGALNDTQGGAPFENLTRKATDGDVFLTQSISYTEIPTELTYALVNKKLGVNLIGGFSTLLLGNNEVAVSANDFEDVLGEANNLSDVSFSTNVGLGFSYQLSKKFKFNVEPMFKYQLNPYTDNSVQFKPYYLGVYSGLSFKF